VDLDLRAREGGPDECPYCHDAVPEEVAQRHTCGGCGVATHPECWAELKRCTTLGCAGIEPPQGGQGLAPSPRHAPSEDAAGRSRPGLPWRLRHFVGELRLAIVLLAVVALFVGGKHLAAFRGNGSGREQLVSDMKRQRVQPQDAWAVAELLRSEDCSEEERRLAALALRDLGPDVAVPAILDQVRPGISEAARERLLTALERLGPGCAAELLHAWVSEQPEDSEFVLEALLRRVPRDPDARPALLTVIQSLMNPAARADWKRRLAEREQGR
jgi:hypothetical protein